MSILKCKTDTVMRCDNDEIRIPAGVYDTTKDPLHVIMRRRTAEATVAGEFELAEKYRDSADTLDRVADRMTFGGPSGAAMNFHFPPVEGNEAQ